jgi:hypothetical protein
MQQMFFGEPPEFDNIIALAAVGVAISTTNNLWQ